MDDKSFFRGTVGILLPFLIFYLVCGITQQLLSYLWDLTRQRLGDDYQAYWKSYEAAMPGMISGLSMLAGLLSVSRIGWKEITASERKNKVFVCRLSGYILLGGLAVTSAMGINILFALIGFTASSQSYAQVAEHQYGVSFAIGLVIFGIISPLAEEVLFRGIIYNRMKSFFPLTAAMIVSSLLFGGYHGNLVQGVYAAVLGLLMVWSYERYKSFAAPFLFHAIANIGVYTGTYKPEIYEQLVTPINGIIFIAAAVILLAVIKKSVKK